MIPSQISVSAQTNLVPHLANRKYIYELGKEPSSVDAIIIDGADLSNFPSEERFQAYFDKYDKSKEYDSKVINDRYIIFYKKGIQLEK